MILKLLISLIFVGAAHAEIHRQGGAELGSLGLLAAVHVCDRHRGTCRAGPLLVAGTRARWCRRPWSGAARRTGDPDQAP